MSNRLEELENQKTLAPMRLTEAFYAPKNLAQRDAQLLATISKNAIHNIETTISNATQFLNDLKMYKECLIDVINIESETSDLATQYGSNPPQQSHTLPGVITAPPLYDLQAIQKDNTRMEELKEISGKADIQKTMMFQSVQADYREMASNFKKLLYSDQTITQFTTSLSDQINKNY